jgi:hypothetical protein
MTVDKSARAVSARLELVSRMSDLRPEVRLASKIDYSEATVDRRLRTVAELRRLCVDLGRHPPSCDA